MSLETDGVWAGGLWNPGVWADGVWREGVLVSAELSGTAVPSITAEEIVAGGETIIITLTGDTWIADITAQRQAIINGITSDGSELNGWNNEVRDNEVVTAVTRTSDTVVTVLLTAAASYDIAASETITVTVPGAALTGASPLVATPTFLAADVLVQHKDETLRHMRSNLRHRDLTLTFNETDLEHNR